MSSVAEGLFRAEATAAPPVDFVVDFGVFDCDRAHDWTDGFWRLLLGQGLVFFHGVELVFDLFVVFDVEMRKVGIGPAHRGVLRLLDPAFWFYVF